MIAQTFGVKGGAAAAWLATQHIVAPVQPNTWQPLTGGGLILRLGRSEYLVEGSAVQALAAAWCDGQPDLYCVPRYDAEFVLTGDAARHVLAEICALDVRPEVIGNSVLMTSAAGISVILICMGETYCLWCDATYGEYMQQALQQISN